MTVLKHFAGSAFGLTMSTEQCPIVDPSGEPINTAEWAVSLRLIGSESRLDIPGTWLSSISPWSIAFNTIDTLPWVPGAYECRLVYVEPDPGSRRFEIPTSLSLEVSR